MRACTVICIVALVFCSSCDSIGNLAGTLDELQQVQRAVSKAVGTDNVTVNLNNGKYLLVGIVNTPLKDLPADQKKAKALEVAQLCYKTYPQAANLDEVSVTFVVHRSYLGVFNYNNATDVFSFKASDFSKSKSADDPRDQ